MSTKRLTAALLTACLGPSALGCGLHALEDGAAHSHGPAGEVIPEGEPFLDQLVRLTSPEMFSRAGEAYFSPSGRWIIFQAVPNGEEREPPRYAMYVAPIERDSDGAIMGMGEPIRLSAPGSANTCGWFHPTLPGVVLYGSTITEPDDLQRAGYSRDTSRYTWDFPDEMEVVTRTVRAIVEDEARNPRLRDELLARPDVDGPVAMWERHGYDAEGSWSPDGRFVLHTQVDPATGDGDLYIYDIASGRSIPIVVEPGYDGGPFFSPDGKRICYRSDREGNNLLQLFVADLAFDDEGVPTGISKETRLTDDGHVNWAPFWHPSGDWLVYASSQAGHHNYEVFAIPSRLEADNAMPESVRITSAAGFDGLPVFDRDGSRMMWTGQRDEPAEGQRRSSQLYVASVVGTAPEGLAIPAAAASDDPASAPIAAALASVSPLERRFHEHVTVLAADWLQGRYPGTPGIAIAEGYIQHHLAEAGLAPAFADADGSASYFQPFEFAEHGTGTTLTARNVGAVLRGAGSLRDRWIIIGAHHDHLGMGGRASLAQVNEVHEGADDNASGVAAVLTIAGLLADASSAFGSATDRRSVMLVTFSAEEIGLNGSRHLAREAPFDLDRCDLMLNIDMIGRVTGGRVSLSGLGSSHELASIARSAIAGTPLTVVQPEGLSSRSDHAAFYDAKVPVLFLTIDPFHSDYHTPADESWKINARGGALASRLAAHLVGDVARHPSPLTFKEVELYERGPSPSMGGIRVRFGIMPGNYNDAEPGVLVQRVSPGASAESGGVLAGDRLMAWDGAPITTVTSWMELMSANEPGDVVTVTVLRDGAEVDLEVELQASKRAAASAPAERE